ncbi:hypothetical protein [Desulfobulbus oligotrophicus]|nr:hypothetical protein [Desulfobulbus oligotrophicus]
MLETKNKKELEEEIGIAVDCLKSSLGNALPAVTNSSSVKNDSGGISDSANSTGESAVSQVKSLACILKESRTDLIDHLYHQAREEKGCWGQLFAYDQTLYRQMQDGKITENEAVKQAVETYVDHRLNFPKA